MYRSMYVSTALYVTKIGLRLLSTIFMLALVRLGNFISLLGLWWNAMFNSV